MPLFRRRRPVAATPPTAAYPTEGSRLPRLPRLLVCDDNNTVTQLVEMLFGRAGWAVDVVSSGEECLRVLPSVQPDVVLLDQRLDGGMSGIEAAEQMRASGFDRPVLLFSAYLDDAARTAARRLDLVPVSKVDFPAVVRHVEAAHGARAATAQRRASRLP